MECSILTLGLYVLGVTSEAQFNNSEISRRRGAVATLLLALRISSLLVLKCTVYLVNNILWPVLCFMGIYVQRGFRFFVSGEVLDCFDVRAG